MVGDQRRNATSQLRLRARLSLKSLNLNLKHGCDPCKTAAVRKRRRLDKEEEECNIDAGGDEENNDNQELEEDETDEEADVTEISGVKRKRSGEQHSHCHCPLINVTEHVTEQSSCSVVSHFGDLKLISLRREKRPRSTECLVYRRRSWIGRSTLQIKKEISRFKQALKLF